MANNFHEIRHKPPLFEHRGDKSTLAKVDLANPESALNWTRRINLKYANVLVANFLHQALCKSTQCKLRSRIRRAIWKALH